MKKIILAGLSTLLLAACSDNDVLENPQTEPAATAYTRYITVSIASNQASSTRADETFYSAQNGENIGIENEYTVGTASDGKDDIMFYLFNSDGTAYTGIANGENGVQYDVEYTDAYTSGQWDHSDNLYNQKTYLVKLNLTDGQQAAPAKIVAVVNPAGSGLTPATTAVTLDALKASTLTDSKNYCGSNAFLMSNSVYKTADGTGEVFATDIPEGSCGETPEIAMQHPVDIYVERVVSKVQLAQKDGSTQTEDVLREYPVTMEEAYYTKKMAVEGAKFPDGYTIDKYITTSDGKYITNAVKMNDGTISKPLKLTLVGWNIFNTFPTTTLEKDISDMPTDWDWNSAAKYRSYWSTTVLGNDAKLTETTLKWKDMKANGTEFVEYPFENTLAYDKEADNNTSILFAGKISADGDTLDLFLWRNSYYTKEDLKTAWANFSKSIYTDEALTTPVKADDFKFLVQRDGYHVYAYLNTDEKKYYHKVTKNVEGEDTEVAEEYNQEELNDVTEQLNWAQYWNGGNCYYFTEILHPQYKLNNVSSGVEEYVQTGDVPGIVRNHWYQMGINSIIGLGTPVPVPDDPTKDTEVEYPDPDPDDPDNPDPGVDPVRPEDDLDNYWYLDVKCIIQPWQIVTNGLDMISKDSQ
jgi:hypothetical protein